MRPGCSHSKGHHLGKNPPLNSQPHPKSPGKASSKGKPPKSPTGSSGSHGGDPFAWLELCRMQFGQEQGCICSLIFFPVTGLLGFPLPPFFFFFELCRGKGPGSDLVLFSHLCAFFLTAPSGQGEAAQAAISVSLSLSLSPVMIPIPPHFGLTD